MAIRNFWVEAQVDGRDNQVAFGPRAKDGGFRLVVYIRREGAIAKAMAIWGYESDGNLVIVAEDEKGERLTVNGWR